MLVRMSDATAALAGVYVRVEAEITEKRRNPFGGFGTPKGGHPALASWNPQAAMWVLDVHAGLREAEQNLAYGITRRLRDQRGGSERNTVKILDGLPSLAAGADYTVVRELARRLESWEFRGRLLLGEIEPFARLPRLPGQPAPACPYCRQIDSLRYRPVTGQVRCIRPGCTDSNGERPDGLLTTGQFSGEPQLEWKDGETGVAGAA
jgi:hypothetical protein